MNRSSYRWPAVWNVTRAVEKDESLLVLFERRPTDEQVLAFANAVKSVPRAHVPPPPPPDTDNYIGVPPLTDRAVRLIRLSFLAVMVAMVAGVLGYGIGREIATREMEAWAVGRGAGIYCPMTGDFRFNGDC